MRKLNHRTGVTYPQQGKPAFSPKTTQTNTKGATTSSAPISGKMTTTSTFKKSSIHQTAAEQLIVEKNVGSNKGSFEKNLDYIKYLTTDIGVKSLTEKGEIYYSLDDNAVALVAICEQYELTKEEADLRYIATYFKFIKYCQQPKGYFFKVADTKGKFTEENEKVNLAESNGRAIWALGYMISKSHVLPAELINDAENVFQEALLTVKKIHSTTAIGYVIKGLYYRNLKHETIEGVWLIKQLANRLVQLYREVENENWKWFQSFLSLDNSIIPEALLCAWLTTGEPVYKEIAKASFDFLLSKKIKENESDVTDMPGPIIAHEYSNGINNIIFALGNFYKVFKEEHYLVKMKQALVWGKNTLNKAIHNPIAVVVQ